MPLLAHYQATLSEDQARDIVRRADPATVARFLAPLAPSGSSRLSHEAVVAKVIAKHPYEALVFVSEGRQAFLDQLEQAKEKVGGLEAVLGAIDAVRPRSPGSKR